MPRAQSGPNVRISLRAEAKLTSEGGGIGWTGATTCVSSSVCTYSKLVFHSLSTGRPLTDSPSAYYSQCLPGSAALPPPGTTTTVLPLPPTTLSTTLPPPSSTTSTTPTSTAIPHYPTKGQLV